MSAVPSVQLNLTYYQTEKARREGIAMLEPLDPTDWKQIVITFEREEDAWVLQQPDLFKIYKISNFEKILHRINTMSEHIDLLKIKIKKISYPEIDEQIYQIYDDDADETLLKGGKRKSFYNKKSKKSKHPKRKRSKKSKKNI